MARVLRRCVCVCAGTTSSLLGGEVYHYHTKLMMKEAKTGGQFVWHQDYGYSLSYSALFVSAKAAAYHFCLSAGLSYLALSVSSLGKFICLFRCLSASPSSRDP